MYSIPTKPGSGNLLLDLSITSGKNTYHEKLKCVRKKRQSQELSRRIKHLLLVILFLLNDNMIVLLK